MSNWNSTQWLQWFKSQAQPLARNDFVYLRHKALNWRSIGEVLSLARGNVHMRSWPSDAEVSPESLAARAEAFKALKAFCKKRQGEPFILSLGSWQGETVDGRNHRSLVYSLRRHCELESQKSSTLITAPAEMFVFAILAFLFLSFLPTVPFGVGCLTFSAKEMLTYFSKFTRTRNRHREELERTEQELRKTLSEVIALEEELNQLFLEMDALFGQFQTDACAQTSEPHVTHVAA